MKNYFSTSPTAAAVLSLPAVQFLIRNYLFLVPGLLLVVTGAAIVLIPSLIRITIGIALVFFGFYTVAVLSRLAGAVERGVAILREMEGKFQLQGVAIRNVEQRETRITTADDKKVTYH